MQAVISVPLGIRFTPWTYEEVSVGAAAVGLTSALVNSSDYVELVHEQGPSRYRIDGGDPTAASGIPLFDRDQVLLNAQEADQVKFIRQGATNGTVRATYYRLG